MRLVTGLHNYTSLKDLKKTAKMNHTQDRGAAQDVAHFQRLNKINDGRRLLEIIGYDTKRKPRPKNMKPP